MKRIRFDDAVGRVFRLEPDTALAAAEGFHRGFLPDHGNYNLSVLGNLLGANNHQIPVQNGGVYHAVPPDPEGEVVPAVTAGIKGQVILDALLGQNGAAGGYISHDGNAVRLLPLRQGSGGLGLDQADGPALAGADLDVAHLRQVLQVEMHRGGGAQAHGLADLPHGGGIALLTDAGNQVVIDLLLHFGQTLHLPRPFC